MSEHARSFFPSIPVVSNSGSGVQLQPAEQYLAAPSPEIKGLAQVRLFFLLDTGDCSKAADQEPLTGAAHLTTQTQIPAVVTL